jgi:glycosyltransferase involved in cell wall biosynthesis
MPKISFVIPTYDGDSYLADTLESIRSQSLKDIEIIVVDDASPDFTPELMDWYVKKDERIKYHRLETNGGVQEARNYGNKLAESELICVNDHDDLSMKHRALYSYHFMNHFKDVKCLTSSYWELDVDGQPMKEWWKPVDMTREVFESGDFVWFHSSACYHKEDILKHPYRIGEQGETDDWIFLDDWTKEGMKFHTTSKVLANCRRLPWSQMQFRRQQQGLQPSYIL